MPRMSGLNREKIQKLTFKKLLAIADDPKSSAAVKVQALTQIAKLAEQLPKEENVDELTEFLNAE